MKVPFVLILLVLFVLPLSAQYSRKDLQNMYMHYLQAEGYTPKVDSDGDVTFKAEGRSFYIEVNEDDLEFFRVVFPNFWEIESETERAEAAAAASWANMRTKVAKVYLTTRDDTSISAELFVVRPEDFQEVFPRCISVITTALEHFRDRMNGRE
jgi:hypothetical protein